jgi:hypothetical protein
MRHALLLAAAIALPPLAAVAQDGEACPMTYDAFETLVPHLDLADCPDGLGGENAFCRLAVSAERAHVFVFDVASGCLAQSRTWEEDAFSVELDD